MLKSQRIYDGSNFCHTDNCCPVVDHHAQDNTVTIHDPAKPENGSFKMTVEEYNTLLKNATPVT